MSRLLQLTGGLALFAVIGVPVLASVLDDAAMLVGAFGAWGLAFYLVTPAAVFVFSLLR